MAGHSPIFGFQPIENLTSPVPSARVGIGQSTVDHQIQGSALRLTILSSTASRISLE
jgi:hypothetical protein